MGVLANYLEKKAAGMVSPGAIEESFKPLVVKQLPAMAERVAPLGAKAPVIVRPIGNEAYGRDVLPYTEAVNPRANLKAFVEPQVKTVAIPSPGVMAAGANSVQRDIDNARAMGVSPAVAANLTPAQKANFSADALPVTMNPAEDLAIAAMAPGLGPLARVAQVPISAAIEAAPEAKKIANEKVIQPALSAVKGAAGGVYNYMQKNSPLDAVKQLGEGISRGAREPLRLIQKF